MTVLKGEARGRGEGKVTWRRGKKGRQRERERMDDNITVVYHTPNIPPTNVTLVHAHVCTHLHDYEMSETE